MVDMLDVVAVEGPAGGVECWMDIQKGVFPNVGFKLPIFLNAFIAKFAG